MSAFLYFLPDQQLPVTREKLIAWGLDYAFDGVPHHAAASGPDGQRGVLLCDQPRLEPHVPAYRPEEQPWRKVPREPGSDGPEIHVGYYREAKPTIDDLAREEILPGELVELCDGHQWQVPLVRQAFPDGSSSSALPAYLDVDDDGQIVRGETDPRYQWLFEVCTPFWEAWLAGFEAASDRLSLLSEQSTEAERDEAGIFHIDCPTLLEDAVRVLSANYRIGLREAMQLQLWKTDAGPVDVLKAACNIELAQLLLLEKKNLLGVLTTSPADVGGPAC